MGVNRGKDFENKVHEALLEVADISVDRFPDPMAGFAGVKNICDFGVYLFPYQFYFELKATESNTLNFKGAITQNQWEGLLEKSKIKGVTAGIIVWFIGHDITAFVPIQELEEMRNNGAKSFNVKDIYKEESAAIIIQGVKKRVFFKYQMKTFLKQLIDERGGW